jgi:hypothetical protein
LETVIFYVLSWTKASGVNKYIKNSWRTVSVNSSTMDLKYVSFPRRRSNNNFWEIQILVSVFLCCGLALEDPRAARILDYQREEHIGSGHYFFR